jgi:hypothetical protein
MLYSGGAVVKEVRTSRRNSIFTISPFPSDNIWNYGESSRTPKDSSASRNSIPAHFYHWALTIGTDCRQTVGEFPKPHKT